MDVNINGASSKKRISIKKILTIYAAIVFITNAISIFLLYAHYGPLTPNGNRYYHSFDMSSVSWNMVCLCIIASLSLLLPLVMFPKSNMKTILNVFPATSKFGKVCSASLTIINIITGTIFSISLLFITIEYLSNHSRVMAHDLETILLALAYIACFLFWGVVDIIYYVARRNK